MRVLVVFVEPHADFRLPEVLSLLQLNDVRADAVDWDAFDETTALWDVRLPSEAVARAVASRATRVRYVARVIDAATSLEAMLAQWDVVGLPPRLRNLPDGFRFLVRVESVGGRHAEAAMQHALIERLIGGAAFARGVVDLRAPQHAFRLVLQWDRAAAAHVRLWLVEEMCEGNRAAMDALALRRRPYLGTTAMDTELALLMANQALARPGALALDPFVGTGSIVVPLAVQGAFALGIEIDSRVVRGTGKSLSNNQPGASVTSNFELFHVGHLADALIADSSHVAFCPRPFLDAVVTDPPYGAREGAKRLAGRDNGSIRTVSEPSPTPLPFIKVRKLPYDSVDLVCDLVDFAARHLVVGGRLVYWLAASLATYDDADLPVHPAMRFLCSSQQMFGRWARWLVTMVKTREPVAGEAASVPRVDRGERPSFATLRDSYFDVRGEDAEPGEPGEPGEAKRRAPLKSKLVRTAEQWRARRDAIVRNHSVL